MAAKRKVADREKLELDYRAGLHTFREMAATHGISGPRIKQIADKEGWQRDLGAKIRQAAGAKLRAALMPVSEAKLSTERTIVDRGADNIVTIVLAHRRDSIRVRQVTMAMVSELELATQAPLLLQDLHDCLAKCAAGEEIPAAMLLRADSALGNVLTLGSRAGILKQLSDSLAKVVAIELQAFGINDPDPPPEPAADGAMRGISSLAERFAAVIAAHGGTATC